MTPMSPLFRHCISVMMWVGILVSGRAHAAGPDNFSHWSFRAWQTDEGLPDNSVTGVAQTDDGYLWVATYAGLLRFNGAAFEAVPLPSLFKKSIRSLLLDRRGRFWLGMDRGSVICVESNSALTFTSEQGLPAERIAAMAEDREGAIWIIYSGTLCRIKDHQITRYTAQEGLPAGLNAWVMSDVRGSIWFSKGGELGVIREGQLVSKLTFEESTVRMCASAKAGIWICAGARLLKYEEDREPVECQRLPGNAEPQVLFEDRSGALWIGTMADGLFRFKGGVLEKIPLSHQSVSCLGADEEGNIWVGTRGGGLNLIRPSAITLMGKENGLPFEAVASVCQDLDGVIWAVGQSGVLVKYQNGKWNTVGAEAGWIGDVATCVTADKAGGVWVGARDRTLHHLSGGVWRVWNREDGLIGGAVHLVFVAANQDVWVVSGSPSRMQRLHDGKLEAPLSLPGENRTIRAMAEGADGQLWIGTLEGHILSVRDSSTLIEIAAGLPDSPSIRALDTDAEGTLWVGYAGAGIGRLKDGKLSLITEAEGVTDDFASQLLTDQRRGLWVMGNRGLFHISLAELNARAEGRLKTVRSQVYGRNEGLPTFQPNTANFPNVWRGSDGRLWFALRSGLLTVQPENVRHNPVPPPVVVERVSVDEKTAALYHSHSPLRMESGSTVPDLGEHKARLIIPADHRKVEIDFAALSFASPENVRFRYQLENFDEDWVEASQPSRASYPHLPAGDYRFHVLACNNAGVWSETGAAVLLVVPPFFWQTWWFRGSALFLFTALVVAIVRYLSFRRLRSRMEQLEQTAALDKERARIARDMHDEVGAKLTRLSLLSEMAGAHPEIPASARSEVQEISETSRETIRSFEEIVWAVNPRNDRLSDLVHYLCRYAEDYFEGSPVRCGFDLPSAIPSVLLPTGVRHQVFLAVKEGFNNILKHAKAQQVGVQVVFSPAEFQIIIEDDGCGFDVAAPIKRAGGGNGLENMRERMRSIGGRLDCQSRPGQGTQLVFTAPVS